MTNRQYVEQMAANGVKTIEHALGINPDDVVRQFQGLTKLAQAVDSDGRLPVVSRAVTPLKNDYGLAIKSASLAKGIQRFLEFPTMLAYHNMEKPVGRWNSHEISAEGLLLGGYVSSGARDIQQLVIDEVLMAVSISFYITDSDYDKDTDTTIVNGIEMVEASLCTVPIDRNTWVEVAEGMGFQAWTARKRSAAIGTPKIEQRRPAAWEHDVIRSMAEVAATSMQLAVIPRMPQATP